MRAHFLNNHFRFFTEDLDHSREIMGRIWERHEIHLNPGWSYSIRWHQADLEHTSLTYCDSPASVHIVSGPVSHMYRMQQDGRACQSINGIETISTPAVACLHAPGQDIGLKTEPFRALMLTLDGEFVDTALTRRFRRLPPFEEWARDFSVQSGPAACLHSLSVRSERA